MMIIRIMIGAGAMVIIMCPVTMLTIRDWTVIPTSGDNVGLSSPQVITMIGARVEILGGVMVIIMSDIMVITSGVVVIIIK